MKTSYSQPRTFIYTPGWVRQLGFAEGKGGKVLGLLVLKCFWGKAGSASPSYMNL